MVCQETSEDDQTVDPWEVKLNHCLRDCVVIIEFYTWHTMQWVIKTALYLKHIIVSEKLEQTNEGAVLFEVKLEQTNEGTVLFEVNITGIQLETAGFMSGVYPLAITKV